MTVSTQTGKNETRFKTRILTAPADFKPYAGLATLSRNGGHPGQAAIYLDKAIILAPDTPELFYNLGNLALFQKTAGGPKTAYRRCLLLSPEISAGWRNLATLERGLCNFEHAGKAFRRALLSISSHNDRFSVLLEYLEILFHLEDRDQTGTIFRILIESAGTSSERVHALAGLPHNGKTSGDLMKAIYKRLSVAHPSAFRAAYNLAQSLFDQNRQREGLKYLKRALAAKPNYALIYHLFATQNEPGKQAGASVELYRRALILYPDSGDLNYNLGVSERGNRNPEGGIRHYRHALAIKPEDGTYRFNYALCLLVAGRLREGLEQYERRWDAPGNETARWGGESPFFPPPFWQGESLESKRLLIWGEQGLGDEIWFSSYLPLLSHLKCDSNSEIIIECDARLVPLLSRSLPGIAFVPRTEPANPATHDADIQCALGSLPYLLSKDGTQSQGTPLFPKPTAYLKTPAAHLSEKIRHAKTTGRKLVGISWRSEKADPSKSFEAPLQTWSELLKRPDLVFLSLQYGDTGADLRNIREGLGVHIYDSTVIFSETRAPMNKKPDGIGNLTTAVALCDSIVSIANSTVMLAHSLGKPCHIALKPVQEDWRFIQDRPVSPWLPTCRLYWNRDETHSAWKDLFRTISSHI